MLINLRLVYNCKLIFIVKLRCLILYKEKNYINS